MATRWIRTNRRCAASTVDFESDDFDAYLILTRGRIEIVGLEVHGERLIRPARQDPALEVGGISSELGILGREITRDGLPDLDQPCPRAESAADRVGRRARATPSQRQMVFPQLGGGARVRV